MHELGIAQSIISAVEGEVERQSLPPVTRIVVRVGTLSDIVPDALIFNFEAITQATPYEQTELVVEEVQLKARCQTCDHQFAVENLFFICPKCNSGQVEVTQGEELHIAYLEVDDLN